MSLISEEGCLFLRSVFDCFLTLLLCVFQAGGQDQERKHKKRRGDFYSVQTSLIVAALKKMLPIGLNMCTPGDQELILLAKMRYGLVQGSRGSGVKGHHCVCVCV